MITNLDDRKMNFDGLVEDRIVNKECPAFDEENYTITDLVNKHGERCCLFEGDVFLEAKKP